jgi:golgin subfamily B member 1
VPDHAILLSIFIGDPGDDLVAEALRDALRQLSTTQLAQLVVPLANARKTMMLAKSAQGAVALLDMELQRPVDARHQVALLIEKATLLDEELLDANGARDALLTAQRLSPADPEVKEILAEQEVARSNWEKFSVKFVQEADAATDRALKTSLYFSAAAALARFASADHEERCVSLLRQAIDVDPQNDRAWFQLRVILGRAQKWNEVASALQAQSEHLHRRDELAPILFELALVQKTQLGQAAVGSATARRALTLSPGNRAILRIVAAELEAAQDWRGLVDAMVAALKERRGFDDSTHLDLLERVATLQWQKLAEFDKAEEYFRRVRRLQPSHELSLEFYRAYYTQRGDSGKLIAMLKQAERSLTEQDALATPAHGPVMERTSERLAAGSERVRSLGLEIAELSEAQLNNPEKAIDAWKQLLRSDPTSVPARAALYRLYQRTEKWNALIDLMKDDAERLPKTDIDGRTRRMFEMIELYRERLKLPTEELSTYNAILKIDPLNQRAYQELADKYRGMARWSELIALLQQRADDVTQTIGVRVALYSEVSTLWTERFGNMGNAVRPLEQILELEPASGAPSVSYQDAMARLKDIFSRRRQWRALIELLGKEESRISGAAAWSKRQEMARLATERVGDNRLAIELLNSLLSTVLTMNDNAAQIVHSDVLANLAGLYDRERRFLAVIEIVGRQAQRAANSKDRIALLEKNAGTWADKLNDQVRSAQVWRQILTVEPGHAKALRVLRDLYVSTGDHVGLQALYVQLGQHDELVDAMLGLSEKAEDPSRKLMLIERAAELATQRAAIAENQGNLQAQDRIVRAWERALALDASHLGAAIALASQYQRLEKWPRRLAMLEIQLRAANDDVARLALLDEIARLCELRMGSKTVALGWGLKAFALDVGNDKRRAALIAMATDSAGQREVANALTAHAQQGVSAASSAVLQAALWRDAATIWQRLADPTAARQALSAFLRLMPGEAVAVAELEQLLAHIGDHQALLAMWRERAASSTPLVTMALSFDMAELQESKLNDTAAALGGYRRVLEMEPAQPLRGRTLAAMSRLQTTLGLWPELLSTMEQQVIDQAKPADRAASRLQMGDLCRDQLHDEKCAFTHYWSALGEAAPKSSAAERSLRACVRYLHDPLRDLISVEDRKKLALRTVDIGRPTPDITTPSGQDLAAALEYLRSISASKVDAASYDRQLFETLTDDLGELESAWAPALRLLAHDPADDVHRASVFTLAGQLDRNVQLADTLQTVAAELTEQDAGPLAHALWIELGTFASERLQDNGLAQRAWQQAIAIDPTDEFASRALLTLFRKQQLDSEVRAELQRVAQTTTNPVTRIAALREVAQLCETVLADPDLAIKSYRLIGQEIAGDQASFTALDRLYTQSSNWTALEQLLEQQAMLAPATLSRSAGVSPSRAITNGSILANSEEKSNLDCRRAELLVEKLQSPAQAVALLREILNARPAHGQALALMDRFLDDSPQRFDAAEVLLPLYEQKLQWSDVLRCLRVEVERRTKAQDPLVVDLLLRMGDIHEVKLGHNPAAISTFAKILELAPSNADARAALRRLTAQSGDVAALRVSLEKASVALQSSHDVAALLEVESEIAQLAERTSDDARAIIAYQRMLSLDDGNAAESLAALIRLYEKNEHWLPLVNTLHKAAQWQSEDATRASLLIKAAGVQEELLRDEPGAIETWQQIWREQPDNQVAMQALARLFRAQQKWLPLTDVLIGLIARATPLDAMGLRTSLAQLWEHQLHNVDEAIAVYVEIVDQQPSHEFGLAALERLYRQTGRDVDVLDVLERQLAVGIGDPATLHEDMAELLSNALGRPHDALSQWSNVLQLEPQHVSARMNVSAALLDLELRPKAFDVLRDLYQREHELHNLAELHATAVDWSVDAAHKVTHWTQVVSIAEHRGDVVGAFNAQIQLLSAAADQPQLRDALVNLERLADVTERHPELIDAYRNALPMVVDVEVARQLHLDVADLSRALRKDTATAITHYQYVLDAYPDDRRALSALESVYRENNDAKSLIAILMRQAELPDSSQDAQITFLSEAAVLCTTHHRQDDAIATWVSVLELAPASRTASDALMLLFQQQGRWHEVLDLYERRLGYATTIEDAVAIRLQMATVCELHTHDLHEAVGNYAAALSNAPQTVDAADALRRLLPDDEVGVAAADALEPYYVARQRWSDLTAVYHARLDKAHDPETRKTAIAELARLYEEQLEDFDNASIWYAKLFAEDPGSETVRDQMHRLAMVTTNWNYIRDAYQLFVGSPSPGSTAFGGLPHFGQHEGSPLLREIAVSLGVIVDRRQQLPIESLGWYHRALEIEPEQDVTPSTSQLAERMEEIYADAQDWAGLVAHCDVLSVHSDASIRRAAVQKRATVLEAKLDDAPRAIDSWTELLADVADEPLQPVSSALWFKASTELERLYRCATSNRHAELVDLMEGRLARSHGSESTPIRMALAQVHLDAADNHAAIDQYEKILRQTADWEPAVVPLERLVVQDNARERVIELLEPIYRRENWWQKLVVILDAKRAYLFDDEQKVNTLHEIAELHHQRGGDRSLARAALLAAWQVDVSSPESLDKLLAATRAENAWSEVLPVLSADITKAEDSLTKSTLWQKVALVHERERGDIDSALVAWTAANAEQPDDAISLSAMDRLLSMQHNYRALLPVVRRRAELSQDAGLRAVLLHRAASYAHHHLNAPADAIDAYREALLVDGTDTVALDALRALYMASGAYRDAAEVIEQRLDVTDDSTKRIDLHIEAAGIAEQHAGDIRAAIAHWQAAQQIDGDNSQVLEQLQRCYQATAMWPEFVEVVDFRAGLERDIASQSALRFAAASAVMTHLRDADGAINRYGELLVAQPTHEPAQQALETMLQQDEHVDAAAAILQRLYLSNNSHLKLVAVYRRQAELLGPGSQEHHDVMAQMANVYETMLRDNPSAMAVWSGAMAQSPDRIELLHPLTRLAQQSGLWSDYRTILNAQLAAHPNSDSVYALSMELGRVCEESSRELPAAVVAYQRAFDLDVDAAAFVALQRVLTASGRSAELVAALAVEANRCDDDRGRANLLHQRAGLLLTSLGDPMAAIAGYSSVLQAQPDHEPAREALMLMLDGDAAVSAAAIQVLLPALDQAADPSRLAKVLDVQQRISTDIDERADILLRLTELRSERLNDLPGALHSALALHRCHPGDEQALADVARFAAQTDSWSLVSDSLRTDAHSAMQLSGGQASAVRLWMYLGDIATDKLSNSKAAIDCYMQAHLIDAHALSPIDELILLYRQQSMTTELIGMLRQRALQVSDSADKRICLVEIAELCEINNDVHGAIEAWTGISALDDGDREALIRLAQLYTNAGRERELLSTLQQTVRVALDATEEKALRKRMASLLTDAGDHAGALQQWQALVDVDPTDASALRSLEQCHYGQADWNAVREIRQRRADVADTLHERLAIMATIAELDEGARQRIDDAVSIWYGVLELAPDDARAVTELQRLLSAQGRWHDVVDVLTTQAERAAAAGNVAQELQLLARVADAWEGPLNNPDAAGEVLEKILHRDPDAVAALTRLSRIHERNGDLTQCQQVLERALSLGASGETAADLHFRLAEIDRAQHRDPVVMEQHLLHALEFYPAHHQAALALEKIALERGDDVLLDRLLRQRLVDSPVADRPALHVELAKIAQRGEDLSLQIHHLQSAWDLSGGELTQSNSETLLALSDALAANDQPQVAGPMLERLAAFAKSAKRNKDVARYRQRQGALLAKQGDLSGAQNAYEEALRMQSTDLTTMIGLGRIYVKTSAWESARRIFQSLVLQTVDDSTANALGIGKAELYLELGRIHLRLQQPDRSKALWQRGLEFDDHHVELQRELAELAGMAKT